jgi:hypothetical protein
VQKLSKSAFKRNFYLCEPQVTIAAKMGILRVISPEEIPVDCSEPVDPKALQDAKATIQSIRLSFSTSPYAHVALHDSSILTPTLYSRCTLARTSQTVALI